MDRYARQSVFNHIGKEGQKKLLRSKVTIIGMGALGTVAANNLCRSGIGHIRMVDRDYVEITNLQRQILYNEDDANQNHLKVIAAFNHLSKVNSEIKLEPIIADANSSNIERLIENSNLVIDATDNWETRLLINEACHQYKIPWIYCAAIGGEGITLNILTGDEDPCIKCFLPDTLTTSGQTCATFGVLNMTTNAIASFQTAEAIKILLGADTIRKELLVMDLWNNDIRLVELKKNPNCPVCAHNQYEYLGKTHGMYATSLCGSDAIQVVPSTQENIDFATMAESLKDSGIVRYDAFSLVFKSDKFEITLFGDGRAIIKNAIDENNAKSIYSEYIGL